MGLFDVLMLAYLHLMEIWKNVKFITDLLQSHYKCPKRNKQYILTRINSDPWPPTRWYRIFNHTTIATFTWFLPSKKSGFRDFIYTTNLDLVDLYHFKFNKENSPTVTKLSYFTIPTAAKWASRLQTESIRQLSIKRNIVQ